VEIADFVGQGIKANMMVVVMVPVMMMVVVMVVVVVMGPGLRQAWPKGQGSHNGGGGEFDVGHLGFSLESAKRSISGRPRFHSPGRESSRNA
jgi:hypothetical protein